MYLLAMCTVKRKIVKCHTVYVHIGIENRLSVENELKIKIKLNTIKKE